MTYPLTRRLTPLLSLAASSVLAACAPVNLLNASIPTFGVTITRDVVYVPGLRPPLRPPLRQKLDIYRPSHQAGSLPVVVFFYGGSWDNGSKDEYLFVATALARRGLLVMVPDYRLYPQVRYPAFLQDCAQAVSWAIRHAAAYGGDAKALFLMGHSAGAYNVAMLTLDPSLLEAAGVSRDAIAGAIALAGPFDFLPIQDPEVQAVFAPAADPATTQPVNHVDGHNPPMLLLAGTDDHTVYPRNTTSLAARIRAAGGPVEERLYPGVGHIGVILSFARWFHAKAPALADSVAFIRRIAGRRM